MSYSLAHERDTVKAMIRLFCKAHHTAEPLCDGCTELADYTDQRLDRCPSRADKPKCSHCEIHCYSPAMRKRITEVMRYAGPRMIAHHPIMALRHLLQKWPLISSTYESNETDSTKLLLRLRIMNRRGSLPAHFFGGV